MAYSFNMAKDPLNVAEQQYATAEEIRFTMFTSCIGLIARNNAVVTGVHLVMLSEDDTPFDNNAAQAAVDLLGEYQEVVVIGQANMWQHNLSAPYDHLIGLLENPTIRDLNDGVYGGRVSGDQLQIF